MNFMGDAGGKAPGNGQLLVRHQGLISSPQVGDIAEDQHHTRHFALGIANRRGALIDQVLRAVFGEQQRMIRRCGVFGLRPRTGILYRFPCLLIDGAEDGFETPPFRVLQRPASQMLSHRIHELHAALLIAGNEGIAHRFQSRLQPLPALNELIRALVRFFQRSSERPRDLPHIPLGVDAQDDTRSNGRQKQNRHQRANLGVGGLYLLVAPVRPRFGSWRRSGSARWPSVGPRSGRAPCPRTSSLRADCPAPYRQIPSIAHGCRVSGVAA